MTLGLVLGSLEDSHVGKAATNLVVKAGRHLTIFLGNISLASYEDGGKLGIRQCSCHEVSDCRVKDHHQKPSMSYRRKMNHGIINEVVSMPANNDRKSQGLASVPDIRQTAFRDICLEASSGYDS